MQEGEKAQANLANPLRSLHSDVDLNSEDEVQVVSGLLGNSSEEEVNTEEEK